MTLKHRQNVVPTVPEQRTDDALFSKRSAACAASVESSEMQAPSSSNSERSPVNGLASTPGTDLVSALQITSDGSQRLIDSRVIVEDVLNVEIEDVGSYALMWTPTTEPSGPIGYTPEDGILGEVDEIPEALALAVGFAFTEGIVSGLGDVAAMWVCEERPDVVNMKLANPGASAVRRRNVVVNSSCGICGGREQLMSRINSAATRPEPQLRLTVEDLARIRRQFQTQQRVFAETGGAHGAALFGPDLEVLKVAEDLGRHNALDKIIGYRILSGKDFAGTGAFVSSRLSYEMVAKAAAAGIEVLAGISAPSSLAVEMADAHGLTLCGFVREHRAEVYTAPERLVSPQDLRALAALKGVEQL